MIDTKLLQLLCCPESHQSLQLADAALLQSLNQQMTAGSLKNRAGQLLKDKLDGGLVRADKQVVYPIINKLPILLVEEGILLTA
jgi:uncharacterized protein YbaR (Trm112 family)